MSRIATVSRRKTFWLLKEENPRLSMSPSISTDADHSRAKATIAIAKACGRVCVILWTNQYLFRENMADKILP